MVHDELDLAPGTARLKLGGGIAGHNGLRDVAEQSGSKEFWRLRLGIGHPGDRNRVADWVLSSPSVEDRIDIELAIDRSLDVMSQIVSGDMQGAMLKLHGVAKPPKVPKPATTAPAAPSAPKGE